MIEYYSKDGIFKATLIEKESGGYFFTVIDSIICLDHNPEFVKKLSESGSYLLRQQCKKCGKSVSNGMKHSLVKDVNSLPLFDESLVDLEYRFRIEARDSFELKRNESAFEEYNRYLNSDKWKLKREKVFERDKNLCQACLTNKATQVHHLTYQNIYDEPLFELISVCARCHDKIESQKPHKK